MHAALDGRNERSSNIAARTRFRPQTPACMANDMAFT
jgi:hypothetical protein